MPSLSASARKELNLMREGLLKQAAEAKSRLEAIQRQISGLDAVIGLDDQNPATTPLAAAPEDGPLPESISAAVRLMLRPHPEGMTVDEVTSALLQALFPVDPNAATPLRNRVQNELWRLCNRTGEAVRDERSGRVRLREAA